eukprot:6541692-Alexandrium_andersonii.AAC.1
MDNTILLREFLIRGATRACPLLVDGASDNSRRAKVLSMESNLRAVLEARKGAQVAQQPGCCQGVVQGGAQKGEGREAQARTGLRI